MNTLALNTDAVLRRGAFDPQGNLKAADTAQSESPLDLAAQFFVRVFPLKGPLCVA